MKRRIDPTYIALWGNRLIAAALVMLAFFLPLILDWYSTVRSLTQPERLAIQIAFYCCSAVTAVALWNLDGLLRGILKKQVFIRKNVSRIRTIQWCCAAISVICLPAALIYYPLVFMVIIMGFLALVVCVLCRVMDTAVAIREENDLTV